jgi:hypothetical protein
VRELTMNEVQDVSGAGPYEVGYTIGSWIKAAVDFAAENYTKFQVLTPNPEIYA